MDFFFIYGNTKSATLALAYMKNKTGLYLSLS